MWNFVKSKFMIITGKRGQNYDFKLKINGTRLERCSTYKYLGLHFDKINWKMHIDYVCKKLVKTCGPITVADLSRYCRCSSPKSPLLA